MIDPEGAPAEAPAPAAVRLGVTKEYYGSTPDQAVRLRARALADGALAGWPQILCPDPVWREDALGPGNGCWVATATGRRVAANR